ncbi:MAG: tRNA (adenosine(37)-N6)-threonylcarbamoyltransferase complex dimerization subunit type 1 TsaB [Clostridia bacterium]|nr:tRNA (adenosine(37)-N6)-threonylcarbamoyltransferase complex dimerization subunit type 1 TsaB [Clostridia bacterium]
MKILSIDTSSKICSVAVLEDNNVIIEKNIDDSLTHSQKLMPMIDNILNELNMKLTDFDLFSCSVGPGSFTGVRIGVSTVKAFCDVTNVPVTSVSSLEGLAYNTLSSNIESNSTIVCSLIDAKNDNVYCGVFKNESDEFVQLEDLCAKNINEVLNLLDKYSSSSILFVGDGAVCHKSLILDKFRNSLFVEDELNKQTSVSIGIAGFNKYNKGIYGDSNSLSPLYLRKSQAERALEGEN